MESIYLKKGTTRFAIVIPRLGIAIKLPYINAIKAFMILMRLIWLGFTNQAEFKHQLKYKLFIRMRMRHSFLWYLARGIVGNINETYFTLFNFRNPLLVPTYFSLFGFINIQPIAPAMGNSAGVKVLKQLDTMVSYCDEVFDYGGPHAWTDNNFTQRKDGSIGMIDYGTAKTWPMIKKYGHRLAYALKTAA